MPYRSSQHILSREITLESRRIRTSAPLVVVCYPNTYEAGMSNLACHFLLGAFSKKNLRLERAFALPQAWKKMAVTFESREDLRKAAVILATLSYEEDYLNFLMLMKAAGIPLKAEDRHLSDPCIIVGGGAVSANPTVLGPYADVLSLGEFEGEIAHLADTVQAFAWGRMSRHELLECLNANDAYYVPQLGGPNCDGGHELAKVAPNYEPVSSVIISPYSHFADTLLIDVNRSCVSCCRFCMASYLYKPFRIADREAILGVCRRWRGKAKTVGLVGTAVASYPGFESLCEEIHSMGFDVRFSSFRIEGLKKQTLEMVASLGVKTITLAPETANEALRRLLNKRVTNTEIAAVLDAIAALPIAKTRLYFMIGIPGERDDDLVELVEFVKQIRTSFRRSGPGRMIDVSLNFLIPKAWTPFQWAPLPPRQDIEQKRIMVMNAVKRNLRDTLHVTSTAGILYQSALSLGGREVGEGLAACDRSRGAVLQRWSELNVDLDTILHKEKSRDYPFPWDFIRSGTTKTDLYCEYASFRAELDAAGRGK